jgi:phenylpyruvate tautomerase PptA (4-oxalocrotonate tautomerase family)
LLWDKLKQYNPDIAVILEEVKEDHLAKVKTAVEKRFV